MRVEWTAAALANFEEQFDYTAREDPLAAGRTFSHLIDVVEGLARFPSMGHPGRIPGTRELVVSGTPFVVAYQVLGQTVEVLRVLHAAQKWPSEL